MRRTCALLVVAFAVLGGFAGIAADYGVPGGVLGVRCLAKSAGSGRVPRIFVRD